jgi:DNA-directed RNA polymerase specialized sigma24 family protein
VGLKGSLSNTGIRLRALASEAQVLARGPIPAPELEVALAGQHQTRLNPDQVERLVERYKAGATTYQLAEEFGCNRNTVSDHLKRAGVKLRRSGLPPEEVERAIELYESGFSLESVGERFGVTGDTVAARLREQGVRIRDAHERRRSSQL